MLTAVVGQTFHGTLAAAPVDQTPKREPANVVPGASASLDLLRERQKKVDFDLMVPTVLERSSWIDRERPIRLYRFDDKDKHKTIRLTYKMGSNDYWGVQQSNWEKAPVLGSRNFTRNIGGRSFELFYNGPHLHMVVLNRKGATYWVVNTLLDRLSNETMLAIAKGLRPISKVHTARASRGLRACHRLAQAWPGTLPTVVSASPSRIAVFGAGYVGLVTGACFAELGHSVVVRDVIPERIAALQRGEVPIYEPGLEELIARNGERLRFTGDVGEAIDGADFVYIAVGTPPTYSGDADLSAVWTVIDELPAIDRRCVVVMKSTVPVGTGLRVRHRLDERGLRHVGYVSNPEFTAEGTAVKDFLHPDRIVVGAFGDEDGDAVAGLHGGIEAPVVRCDVASAEMIKLAANAALMTRISFINEIANVCEATGADVVRVAEGIGLDRRIGPSFLRAGIGFGGSCFPKDSLALKQLAANSGYHFQLLNAVIEVNELQKRRVIGKLNSHLGSFGTSASRCSGSRSSRTRTTCGRRRASSWRAAARRGGGRGRVGSDRRRHDLHGVEIADTPEAAGARRGRGRDRDRVAAARGRRLGCSRRDDAHARPDRRAEHARSGAAARGGVHGRRHRARRRGRDRLMEAIVLAGGKAERMGDATEGRPKSLVEVGGKPLLAWQIGRLHRAGVDRVIISCSAGQEPDFEEGLAGLGVEIVCAGETERLGRGGAIRFAASFRAGERRRAGDERRRARRCRFHGAARAASRERRGGDGHGCAAAVAVRPGRPHRRRSS